MKNALLLCTLLIAAPAFAADLPQWIAGSWRLDTPDARVEEHWMASGGGNDFPQRIIYWRDGAKLCARTEGTLHGKSEGEEWCYTRMEE